VTVNFTSCDKFVANTVLSTHANQTNVTFRISILLLSWKVWSALPSWVKPQLVTNH